MDSGIIHFCSEPLVGVSKVKVVFFARLGARVFGGACRVLSVRLEWPRASRKSGIS